MNCLYPPHARSDENFEGEVGVSKANVLNGLSTGLHSNWNF